MSILLPSGNSIKNIQRGQIYTGNGTQTATASLSSVDVTKSIVNQTGWQGGNGGFDQSGALYLTDGTTLTYDRGTGNTSNVRFVCFEVIEFY